MTFETRGQQLLGSCSLATLLIACGMPAWAACTVVGAGGVTNPPSGTVSGYCVNGPVGTSGPGGERNITNQGTIGTSGISFSASGHLEGQVNSTGTIVGGIGVAAGGAITRSDGTVVSISGSSFSGGISNAGQIAINESGSAIHIQNLTQFAGGITNSGTIEGMGAGFAAIQISNVATVSGSIVNTSGGRIRSGGDGLYLQGVQTVTSGITNTGQIVVGGSGLDIQQIDVFNSSNIGPGISNAGVISAGAGKTDIAVNNVTLFNGGITNSGTLTVTGNGGGITVAEDGTFNGGIVNAASGIIGAESDITVAAITSFSGGVINYGSITGSIGVDVDRVSTFSGGLTNAGSIYGDVTALRVHGALSFGGGISNSGSISDLLGIAALNNQTFVGGVTNSGTLTVRNGLIVQGNSSFSGAIVNSGTIRASSEAIVVSLNGTVANGVTNSGTIFGGVTSVGGMTVLTPGTIGIDIKGNTAFAGGVLNSGTLIERTGISILPTGTFSGGVTNTGRIEGTRVGSGTAIHVLAGLSFSGGISNSGTITGAAYGIKTEASTMSGGLTNSGQIAAIKTGVAILNSNSFSGDVVNNASGTILAGASGIEVENVKTFAGSIANAGTISASSSKIGIHLGALTSALGNGISTFVGGITNSGLITGAFAGIETSYIAQFGSPSSGGGITNTGTISSGYVAIDMSADSFYGGIQNSGRIVAPTVGIRVSQAGSVFGGITNSGIIISSNAIDIENNSEFVGDVKNSGTLQAATAVNVQYISTFTGNIVNSGTLQAAAAVNVQYVSTFTGNIVNSGTINNGLSSGSEVATNYALSSSQVETYIGEMSNAGSIHARYGIFASDTKFAGSTGPGALINSGIITGIGATGTGIYAAGSSFAAVISNSGTITNVGVGLDIFQVSTFTGGVSNSGRIFAEVTGIYVGGIRTANAGTFTGNVVNTGLVESALSGIAVSFQTTFSGSVINAGTVRSGQDALQVSTLSVFTGGVTNSGSIHAGGTGILVSNVSSFNGDIVNTGRIESPSNLGISAGYDGRLSGNISNKGTIVAATGIGVGPNVTFAGGAVVNTGTIIGTSAAIDVSAATSPVIINQAAGLISGAIKLSPQADVLNISGGQIAGNIVGAGSSDTINFELGTKSFTYGSSYHFSGISQINVNSGSTYLDGASAATNTTVNGGLLEVGDASNPGATLTSPVSVVGGTLAGHGTIVGAVTIGNAGTLLPGGSIGVLTVNGNLTFNGGSTYAAQFETGQSARTQVNGSATLGNANVKAIIIAPAFGVFAGRQYTILTATTPLTDKFNPKVKIDVVSSSFTPNFKGVAGLTYDTNNVFLSLPAYDVTLVLPPGATTNAQNAARAFDNAISAGTSIPEEFQTLAGLSGPALTSAVNQLAGQTQGSFGPTGFLTQDLFVNLLLNPYIQGRDGFGSVDADSLPIMSYAPSTISSPAMRAFSALHAPTAVFQPHVGYWAAGYGASGSITGNTSTGGASSTSQIYGLASGADYRLTPDSMIGVAVGGGTTAWQLGQGAGSGRSDMVQAGLYGSTHNGPAYLSAAFAYALHHVSTSRVVSIGGSNPIRGQFNADFFTGRVEAGYRLPYAGSVSVSPYGAVRTQTVLLPAYKEYSVSGATFALNYTDRTFTTTRTEAGAWFDSNVLMQRGAKLYARLAYVHDFYDLGTTTAFFQSLPNSSSFIINSVKPARDGGLVTAGIEYQIGGGWSVLGRFDGELSKTTDIYAGTAMLKKVW